MAAHSAQAVMAIPAVRHYRPHGRRAWVAQRATTRRERSACAPRLRLVGSLPLAVPEGEAPRSSRERPAIRLLRRSTSVPMNRPTYAPNGLEPTRAGIFLHP